MTDFRDQDSNAGVQDSVSDLGGRNLGVVQKQLRELTFLHETSQVLTATLDLDSVLRSLMAQVRDYFQVEAASVALLDEEREQVVFRVAVGRAADAVMGVSVAVGQGVAGWVVQTGRPALVPTVETDVRFYAGVDEQTGFRTQMMLAVPIKFEGRPIGVIEAINPASGQFDEDAQRLLHSVADLAAVAIRNAELYERVLRAEHQYASLFNESIDPIVVLDLEGRLIDLNQRAQEMFDHSSKQLIGTDFWAFLDLPSESYAAALQCVEDGGQYNQQVKLQSGAEILTLETHMTRIDYGGQEALQWVGHDVSDRIALEQMREDLTHMIVHDLRNPLGSMMSSLQLIRTALVERDETLPISKLVRIAMRSGQKLYLLTDSLLDLRRLEAGETELKRTPAAPKDLVREAIEQVQPMAMNKQQELSVRVDRALPVVTVDREMILRVLTNLLDNAIKFTPKHGHVSLSVECGEDGVRFVVSDTGPGIAPEYHTLIFERFTRLKNTEGLRGTGLGLAFCKLAVEAHGGRIWVESELGRGSNFCVLIPVEEE